MPTYVEQDRAAPLPIQLAAQSSPSSTRPVEEAGHPVRNHWQEVAERSPRQQQLRQLRALAREMPTHQASPPVQRRANRTGLPDRLKSGIESLSGLPMDDVRVYYNSPRPAQLQAHAFAQGSDIHLGPGQERHLPHEAWHVVQQQQGSVRPMIQLRSGVLINDEAGLEREADVMGTKALTIGRLPMSGAELGRSVRMMPVPHRAVAQLNAYDIGPPTKQQSDILKELPTYTNAHITTNLGEKKGVLASMGMGKGQDGTGLKTQLLMANLRFLYSANQPEFEVHLEEVITALAALGKQYAKQQKTGKEQFVSEYLTLMLAVRQEKDFLWRKIELKVYPWQASLTAPGPEPETPQSDRISLTNALALSGTAASVNETQKDVRSEIESIAKEKKEAGIGQFKKLATHLKEVAGKAASGNFWSVFEIENPFSKIIDITLECINMFGISYLKKAMGFLSDAKKQRGKITMYVSEISRLTQISPSDSTPQVISLIDILKYSLAKVKRRIWEAVHLGVQNLIKFVSRLVTVFSGGLAAEVSESVNLLSSISIGLNKSFRMGKGVYKFIRGTKGANRKAKAEELFTMAAHNEDAARTLIEILKKENLSGTLWTIANLTDAGKQAIQKFQEGIGAPRLMMAAIEAWKAIPDSFIKEKIHSKIIKMIADTFSSKAKDSSSLLTSVKEMGQARVYSEVTEATGL